MKYTVELCGKWYSEVTIEADNENEACEIAMDKIDLSEIELDCEDAYIIDQEIN